MDVETRTMIEFQAISARQSLKGIEKYGHPIDLTENLDWYTMAMQELVDLARYLTALKMQFEDLEYKNELFCHTIEEVAPSAVSANIQTAQDAGDATLADLYKARKPWESFWERHGVQDAG